MTISDYYPQLSTFLGEEGDQEMAANQAFATKCKDAVEKNSKKPRIVAVLNKLRAEAMERYATMATKKNDTKVATHDMDGGEGEETMSDADMAEHLCRMADDHEKAGRGEDAKFCRAMAAEHKSRAEEMDREAHRKDAEAAAKKETDAAQSANKAQFDELKTMVGTLTTQLGDFKNREVKDKAINLVEKHIREGKVTPATREWAVEYCMKDPTGYEKFIEKAPVIVVNGADPKMATLRGADVDGVSLNSSELHVASAMGVDPKAVAAMKKTPLVNRPLHV